MTNYEKMYNFQKKYFTIVCIPSSLLALCKLFVSMDGYADLAYVGFVIIAIVFMRPSYLVKKIKESYLDTKMFSERFA